MTIAARRASERALLMSNEKIERGAVEFSPQAQKQLQDVERGRERAGKGDVGERSKTMIHFLTKAS
jgi:hypothetical protein